MLKPQQNDEFAFFRKKPEIKARNFFSVALYSLGKKVTAKNLGVVFGGIVAINMVNAGVDVFNSFQATAKQERQEQLMIREKENQVNHTALKNGASWLSLSNHLSDK